MMVDSRMNAPAAERTTMRSNEGDAIGGGFREIPRYRVRPNPRPDAPERDSWDRTGAPEVVLASRPLKSRPGAADPSAELLAKADGYARREGISRAELIARGLTAILPKDRSDRKTG